ncbi:hypothetical protein DCAR_0416245 [Daucus carota subsp. sativus]|uniref:AB hydrolase-1 domain-containing protein n=1 Tax=Daucus carota subsp. sativus TaxID=79200 RepID=A0AAF0WVK5_DAUCS|nr:PREDICTED: methylesterase 17 [Daucus carota subsp. sativus]WOG96907.1 hypothetical protein DCAR_0416245 [Daucus carota subsp. sativus]
MKAAAAMKPHFVLIHGISGGAWCWYKIKSLLENSGYRVSCIDLKCSGIDPSDANKILCFDDYNKPLMDFMAALPENDQVILVGHSAGGLSVTAATHKFAEKISLAVYVAATMLQHGYMTPQDLKDGVPDLSDFGDAFDLEFESGKDQPPTSALLKKELQRKIAHHMSPDEDSTLAAMLSRPGPIQALLSAKFAEEDEHVTCEVPRIYIKTTYDRVIKPEQQDAMIKRWPPSEVYALESDHSPFFSTPFPLFDLLVKATTSPAAAM